MALSRELYQRFIKGQCTGQEEMEVLHYFSRHPEAMEEYLQVSDWEDFEPSGKLHPAVTEKVLGRINRHILQSGRWRHAVRSVAVAAVLTGIAALVWTMVKQADQTVQQAPLARRESRDTAIYRLYRNSSLSTIRLVLEDSSTIRLQPGSRIKYRQGFDSSRREIWLQGSARFDVAKDSRRPFTVYADVTATTALGTSFSIAADSVAQRVTVKLYSGKVMVRQYGVAAHTFATQYLLPGDELVYAADASRVQVHKAARTRAIPQKEVIEAPAAPQALVYRKQPLAEVLAALEHHFNIEITYNAKALAGIRVTAEFSDTETPEQILQTIALLNNLTVARAATGGYILQK